MPKADRCAELKKEANKSKKKFVAEVRTQKEAKEQALLSEEPEEVPRGRAAKAAGGSTFTKVVAAEEQEDSGGEEEETVSARPAPPVSTGSSKSKKESAAERKKREARSQVSDLEFLASEQRAAARARIIDRLLHLLVVGYVIDFTQKKETPAAPLKEARPKKKGKSSDESDRQWWDPQVIKQKLDVFAGPMLMLGLFVAIIAARMGEESFMPDHSDERVDHYGALGVPKDESILGIRKAYKALAMEWHPDKNPDCQSCAERFAEIGKAYEVLSNPELKKAYDQRKKPEGQLQSAVSESLSAADFEDIVLRSNEVWMVQIFDPSDGASRDFHPIWEEISLQYQGKVRFGRIDATQHRRALDYLPQRVVLMPLVYRFARGLHPESFLGIPSTREAKGEVAAFRSFLLDSYPKVHHLETAEEMQQWWSAGRQQILISRSTRGGKVRKKEREALLEAHRLAHEWEGFFEFAQADVSITSDILGAQSPQPKGAWAITLRTQPRAGGNASLVVSMPEDEKLGTTMQGMIAKAMAEEAPFLTKRNHKQLCGNEGHGRKYCLVLVSLSEAATAQALEDLAASKAAYAQESLEGGSEEDPLEDLHIQPVRVQTWSNRMPWQTVAVGSAFSAVWAEAKYSQTFIVELESKRVAVVKLNNLREVFQQVAYEDLKFIELPETTSIVRGLPDPESPMKRELVAVLSTFVGGLSGFVAIAVFAAVVPELPVAAVGIASGASILLLAVIWPRFCRWSISLVWCTIFTEKLECQTNL